MVVRRYVYDLAGRVLTDGLSGEYVWGGDDVHGPILKNDGTRWLYALTDAAGSTTALVNANAQVTDRFWYEPYGNVHHEAADWTHLPTVGDFPFLFHAELYDPFTRTSYAVGAGTFDPLAEMQISPNRAQDAAAQTAVFVNRLTADPHGDDWQNYVPVFGFARRAYYDWKAGNTGYAWAQAGGALGDILTLGGAGLISKTIARSGIEIGIVGALRTASGAGVMAQIRLGFVGLKTLPMFT